MSVAQGKAREILGDNFFGAVEWKRYLGDDHPFFAEMVEDVALSLTEGCLEDFSRQNMMLTLIAPLSILEMRTKNMEQFFQNNVPNFYESQKFVSRSYPKLFWQLISKRPIPGSSEMTDYEQSRLFPEGFGWVDANALVQGLVCHHLHTGRRLLEDTFVRTADLDAGAEGIARSRVLVGRFDRTGLSIGACGGNFRHSMTQALVGKLIV